MDSRIVFIPISENLKQCFIDDIQQNNRNFSISQDIPIPIEICNEEEGININMAVLGMLRVIEAGFNQDLWIGIDFQPEWINYYSEFVLALRPDIIHKLAETALYEDKNYQKANMLVKNGKAEEALGIIRTLLNKYPLAWNGWFLLGWALRLLGRWGDAVLAFRKAKEIGGSGSDTFNELAISLMECGDYPGAKKELETALVNDPENIKIISNLGVLALKRDRKEEALGFFKTVLEYDPNDEIARKYINKLSD